MKLSARLTTNLGSQGIPLDHLILAYAHLLENRDVMFLPLITQEKFWEHLFFNVGITPGEALFAELQEFVEENFDAVSVPSGGGAANPALSLKEEVREEAVTYRGRYSTNVLALSARIAVVFEARGFLIKDATPRPQKPASPRREWLHPAYIGA